MKNAELEYAVCWRSSSASEKHLNLRLLCFLWARRADGNHSCFHFIEYKNMDRQWRCLRSAHRNLNFFIMSQSSCFYCKERTSIIYLRTFLLLSVLGDWNTSQCFPHREAFLPLVQIDLFSSSVFIISSSLKVKLTHRKTDCHIPLVSKCHKTLKPNRLQSHQHLLLQLERYFKIK